jgi:hypothetical protein
VLMFLRGGARLRPQTPDLTIRLVLHDRVFTATGRTLPDTALGAGIRPTKARSVAGIPLRAKRAALVGGLRRGPACGTRADKAERAADAGPAAPQAPLLI